MQKQADSRPADAFASTKTNPLVARRIRLLEGCWIDTL